MAPLDFAPPSSNQESKTALALDSATPELRAKLHKQLERIEGVHHAVQLSGDDSGGFCSPRTVEREGEDEASGGGSCSESARSDGSDDQDEEPLDYMMLAVASRLPGREAAALMEKIRRNERRHARIEQRLRKQLSAQLGNKTPESSAAAPITPPALVTASLPPLLLPEAEAMASSQNEAAVMAAASVASLSVDASSGVAGAVDDIRAAVSISSADKEARCSWFSLRVFCAMFAMVAGFTLLVVCFTVYLLNLHRGRDINTERVPPLAAERAASPPLSFDSVHFKSTSVDSLVAVSKAVDSAFDAAAMAVRDAARAAAAADTAASVASSAACTALGSVEGGLCAAAGPGRPEAQELQTAVAQDGSAASSTAGGNGGNAFSASTVRTHPDGVELSLQPPVTAEARARERAAELAINQAMRHQMRRAMEIAAERLAADEAQKRLASQVDAFSLPVQPAQRRAILRERVRALEESGYQVLLRPPDEASGSGESGTGAEVRRDTSPRVSLDES